MSSKKGRINKSAQKTKKNSIEGYFGKAKNSIYVQRLREEIADCLDSSDNQNEESYECVQVSEESTSNRDDITEKLKFA